MKGKILIPCVLLSGVLLFILLLSTVTAQVAVLVSNLGDSPATGTAVPLAGSQLVQQEFTTGPGSTNYTLSNVELYVKTAAKNAEASKTATVTIYERNTEGVEDYAMTDFSRDTKLASVTTTAGMFGSAGTKTIDFSTNGVTLEPSTTYAVRILSTSLATGGNDLPELVVVAADDEEGTTGWSIANDRVKQTIGGSYATDPASLGIRINGEEVTAVQQATATIALAATSDTGITSAGVASTDKITSDTTPDIVVAGYNSGDTITVTATHATASDVTATITGDGTATLGTLAEGVWSISADAGGTSSNTLEITVLAELVSTMGQSDNGGVVQIGRHSSSETRKVAQKFTTGRAGYTVKEIHFDVATAYGGTGAGNSVNIELEIMTANGDNPGSRVGSILNHFAEPTVTVGDYKYEIPSNKWVTLAPNTEYFLVFQIKFVATRTFSIQQTASNAETGLPGWSMEDECRTAVVQTQAEFFGSAGTWANCASDATLKLGLYGNTNPSIFLKASSDTGSSNTDNITRDNTPTFTVSGLNNNELVTVTATQTGQTTPIKIRTGNGDVTFSTLANGVWSVRGSDGTTGTPSISVTIDRTSPTAITGISSIPTGSDTTPNLTFTTPEAGTLVANSACGITAQAVTAGSNTITLTALAPGTYGACTIQMADVAGNVSPSATIPSFTITTGPTIDLKSDSDTGSSDTDNITNDVTPTFTVSGLDNNATVRLAASQSGETNVTGSRTGNGDVTLGTLVEGVWSVAATDGTTAITLDITVDITAPTAITSISSIPTGTDTTPDLTFTAPEAGTLVANTACGITAEAVTTGSNTITLTALAPGTHGSCTIQMADVAGNTSPTATIPSFTITGPAIDLKASSDSGSSDTDNVTNDNEPTFTVAGLNDSVTVTVTADHATLTDVTATRSGNGDVTLGTLADGVWSVSASDGTTTTPSINVTIDTTVPGIVRNSISSIGSTADRTPDLTFSTTEAGVLDATENCGIASEVLAVTQGQNTITLSTLVPGTYSTCNIWVIDVAGNISGQRTIPSFTITGPTIDLKASSDLGSSDTDNITSDTTPTFTVSGLNNSATVTVTADHATAANVTNTRSGNGDVTLGTLANGDWSVSASDGTTTTPSITITIDTTAPTAITGVSSIGTTADTTPDLTFTAPEAGTLVANSACGISPGIQISAGQNTITLTARTDGTNYAGCNIQMTDVAGNLSPTTAIPSFTIQVLIVILKASSNTGISNSDRFTSDSTPTFTVSGAASGASITVTITPLIVSGVTTAVTLTRTGNGDVPVTTALADGIWEYRGTDETTTTASIALVIDTLAPTLVYTSAFSFVGPLSSTDNVINKADFEATAADTLSLIGSRDSFSFGYSPVVSSTTCNDSLTYATAIPQTDDITSDGTWKVCIKISDEAGNIQYLTSSTFSRDITVPVISNVGSIGSTFDTTPNLSFTTSEAGTLVANSACGITAATVTTGANTITLTALSRTAHASCTIQMTDAAGNTGTAVNVPSFTITDGPTVDLKASSDSGNSDTDNITKNTTPTITVSNYASNASVTVTATQSGETTVTKARSGNGDVTLGTLAEGVWTVSASDGTTTSNEIEITIDTTAPTKPGVPTFSPASDDSGISNADNITKNTRPSFTSSHSESVFAEYTLDSTVSLLTVRGSYSFRPASALAEGAHSISVKSVDLAGNKSVASDTRSFTVDTTAPTISSVSTIGSTIDTTPDLTFTTSEAGTLVANSGCGITAQAVTSGSNTITLSELAVATYPSCTIQMTDSAGNTGTAVSITSFTIQLGPKVALLASYDTGTSDTDGITNTDNPAFIVSGFASDVRVKVIATHTDGTVITTTMPTDGNTQSIASGTFADGVWTVIAQTSDGTITSPSITITIDTVAPGKPATPSLAQTSDSGVSDSDDITNITNPLVGTTTTGEGYVYEWTVNGTVLTSSTTFHTNTGVLSEGLSGAFVKVTDVAGNQSVSSDVYTFTVDTTAPTISNVGSIGTTFDDTPDLSFTTSEAGVLVANSGCGITAATVASGSNTITLTALSRITHSSCTINMSDVAGNTGTAVSIPSFTIEAGGIAIAALSTDPAPSREATATVTGSSPSDLNWALFDPGATPAETCGSGLTFTSTYVSETALTIASAEADNQKKACFRATISGTTVYQETDTITGIDTTNPSALLTLETQLTGGSKTTFTTSTSNIFLKVGDKFILTDASTDAGSGIDTSTRGLTFTRGTQQQHTDGNANTESPSHAAGVWTYTVAAGDNGILKYVYSISDRAGNSDSADLTITNLFVDTTAPITPILDLDTPSDSGSSVTDNVTNDTTPSFTIENPTARITGSAINNEAGKSEEVIEWHMTAAGSSTFTKQTGSTDTFTPATALTDGVYKIKALFKDKAGNTTDSNVITFTIDTTAPGKPAAPNFLPDNDSGISSTDNITNINFLFAISVTTSESNPTVEWTLNSDVQPITSTSYIPLAALDDGDYTMSVKITDAAGNQSPASDDFTFTIDTTPPSAPSSVETGLIVNDTTPDITFEATTGTNDIGAYKVHVITNTTLTDETCPTKAVTTDTLTTFANTVTSTAADVTFTPGTALTEGKYCVYVEQSDVAGNRVISPAEVLYIDTTPIDKSGIVVNLLDAFDSTRPEVTADGESDSDGVWTPGKTDDYTKETTVTIEISNIPVETIMGKRRNVLLSLSLPDITPVVVTRAPDFENPTTDTVSHTFTGVSLIGHATTAYLPKDNLMLFSINDQAGNNVTLNRTLEADTETKTPNTPDLAAASDSGTSDTDDYTNAEYLNIVVEDDDADTNREHPTIVRLYTWTDSSTNPGEVDAAELTPVQVETSPSDSTDNHIPTPYLLKGATAGVDATFQNVVLPEGTHLVVAGQIDKAGNDEAYSAPLTIYIDRTAPTAPTAPTLNSEDDTGAERPGALIAEKNRYRTDAVTSTTSDLSFFGCVDPSDFRTSGATDVALVTAIVKDATDTIITDTATDNTGESGSAVTFDDTLLDSAGDPVRPTLCTTGLSPYKLDLDETYGTANQENTYSVVVTATDLAGNTSEEGASTTLIIDQKKPSDSLGTIDLDALTDNGENTNDNTTSLTDLLYTTNKHSLDNNGAQAYQTRSQKTISHYEIALQLYKDGATEGAVFTAPSVEQVTYFQNTTIPEQVINGTQTLPERILTGDGIALLIKGLSLSFDQYSNVYQTRVRAVDVAGNIKELFPTSSVSYLLPPPPITGIDLADSSDTGSGVTGTDTDNLTKSKTWTITGSFTYRERDGNAEINTVKARIVRTADTTIISSADITAITHGAINGTCADESDACSETDDTDSTFTHTFTHTTLSDGDYRIEVQTYNGSEAGAINSGANELVITYDSTPPSTTPLIANLSAVGASIVNGELISVVGQHGGGTRPLNGGFLIYKKGVNTPVRTFTPSSGGFSFFLSTPAELSDTFAYEFAYTDAAGNIGEKVALPPLPDIRTVRLGDGTPTEYAAVGIAHPDSTPYNLPTTTISLGTHQTGGTCSSFSATPNAYAAYTNGFAVRLTTGNTKACFYHGHTLNGVGLYLIKDTQGASDFASVQVHEEDDTTHALIQRDRTKEAYTKETRPRFIGSSLPEVPVRLYRVSKATFDAATTGDEWTELAIDSNKMFDGTTAKDGSFQIPSLPTALGDGVYYLAARISLDEGVTYTDAAQIFTLTIDTTPPLRSNARDETVDGVFYGAQPLVVFDNLVIGNGYTATDTPILTGNDDFHLQHLHDGQARTDLHVEVRIHGTSEIYYRAPGFGNISDKVGDTFSSTTQPGFPQSILDSNGEYRLRFTVTDKAGNQYQEFVAPFFFDNEAPEIQIIQVGDEDFLIYATDNVDTDVTLKITERSTKNCQRPRHATTAYSAGTLLSLTNTSNYICVSAEDEAGNITFKSSANAITGIAQLQLLQADDTGYSDTDRVTNKQTVTITGTVAEGTIARLYFKRIKDARGTPVTEPWQQSKDALPQAGQTTVTFSEVEFTQEGTYQLGGTTNTVDTTIGSGATYDGNFVPAQNPIVSGELTIDRTAIHKLDTRFPVSERGQDLIDPKLLYSYPVRLENFFDLHPEDGNVQITATWGPYSDTLNPTFKSFQTSTREPYIPQAIYANCPLTAQRDACEVRFEHLDLLFAFFAPKEEKHELPLQASRDYEEKRKTIQQNTISCAEFKADAAHWQQVKADLIANGIDADNIILPYAETCEQTLTSANARLDTQFVSRVQALRTERAVLRFGQESLFYNVALNDIPVVYVLGATSQGKIPLEALKKGESVTYPLTLTITDKAGNTVNLQATRDLTADTTPPTATLYRNGQNYWVEAQDPSYTQTYGEAGIDHPTKVFITKGTEVAYTQRSKNCGELAQQQADLIAQGVPAENIFAPFTFPCTDATAVATRAQILQSSTDYTTRQTALIKAKVAEDPNDAITKDSHVTFAMLPTLHQLGVGASSKVQEPSGTQPLENTCSAQRVEDIKGPFLTISDDRIVTKGEIGDSNYKLSVLKQDHFTTDSFNFNIFNEAFASDRYTAEIFCVVITDVFGNQTFLPSTEAKTKRRKGSSGGGGSPAGFGRTLLASLDSLFNPTDNEQQPQQPLTFTAQAPLIQAPLPQQARLTSTFDQNIGAGQETEDVRALQQFLNTEGFLVSATGAGSPGQETAYFGTKTAQALTAYQEANNLPATGFLGPLTRAHIEGSTTTTTTTTAPPAPRITRTLSTGQRGEDVQALQQFLNAEGFLVNTTGPGSPGQETTYFGTLTAQAVAAFQQANGLPAVGIVGPQTRALLERFGKQTTTTLLPQPAPAPQPIPVIDIAPLPELPTRATRPLSTQAPTLQQTTTPPTPVFAPPTPPTNQETPPIEEETPLQTEYDFFDLVPRGGGERGLF